MIPVPSGVRVWLAVGRTDMRKGMNGLALQVQQGLGRDPHAGDLYVFRGARGDLLKIVWHDGIGMSLYAKRLERGRFIWRRRPTVWSRSLRRSWLTCLTGSIGATRFSPGGRKSPAEAGRWLLGGCGLLTHPVVERGGALGDVAEPGACRPRCQLPCRSRPISPRRTR